MSDHISIGKFVATFGIAGELVLKHVLGKKTNLKGVEVLFTEEGKGNYLPWFIQSAKAKTEDEILVKIEGIDTKEAAQKITQKQVCFKSDDFQQHASKDSAISLLGFMVIDEGKRIGNIIEVIEQPHQILCTILVGEKEAYIPLHQDSLINIDRKKKEVNVSLPDGLLELYL